MTLSGSLGETPSLAVRLMEHLIVPTFVVDCHGIVVVWNKACERLTGVPATELIGTRDHWKAFYKEPRPCLCDLVSGGRYGELGTYFEAWNGGGLTDYGVSLEAHCDMPRLPHGLYLSVDAGPIYDESGTLVAVVETLRDITAAKEAQSALQDLATRDGLTGLLNRRGFDHALASEVARASVENTPVSLLMLDIDYFKRYNDSLGHVRGDECLKAVAHAVAGVLRAHDIAARYGGEEFAVILAKTDEAGAGTAAQRLQGAMETLAAPHPASPVCAHVTVSIGGVTGQARDLTPGDLVTSADAALYTSKREGRNRVSFSHVRSSDLVLF